MVTPQLRVVPKPSGDTVFRRLGRDVARLAYRLVGRDGDVDDLVQDVFLAAHRSMPPGLPDDECRRWLSTVAVRLAGRRLRRRRLARFFGFGDDGPDVFPLASSVSPETSAVVAQLYRRLDTLPVDERLAWTLRHVENEPLEEVARLSGCSLATAKRRIARAQLALTEGAAP